MVLLLLLLLLLLGIIIYYYYYLLLLNVYKWPCYKVCVFLFSISCQGTRTCTRLASLRISGSLQGPPLRTLTIAPWSGCFDEKIRWQKGMWKSLKHGISVEWDLKRSSVERSGVFSEGFASTAHLILPHVRFLRRWSPASVVWRRTTSSRRVIWRRWSEAAVFVQTKEAGPKTHWFIATDTAATSLCTRVSVSV